MTLQIISLEIQANSSDDHLGQSNGSSELPESYQTIERLRRLLKLFCNNRFSPSVELLLSPGTV